MSRPSAPSLHPVITVIGSAIIVTGLGRLFIGSGEPGVFGVVVVVLAMIGMVAMVLSRDNGAMPLRFVAPTALGLFLLAAFGAFAL